MIDSHAHLGDERFAEDRDAVVERGPRVVNICTDEETLRTGLALRAKYPDKVFLAAATTPHDVETQGESFFPIVEEHLDQLVAVGETGLDYFYEHSPRELQQHYLLRYAAIDKPLVIHCRDAFADLFRLLDRPDVVIHCFTGTPVEAQQAVERGWLVSFSGIVTFKRSELLREAAAELPLESILIETDAPYLAPQTHRGQRNEPAYVAEVAEVIAAVRGIDAEAVVRQTAETAERFFQLQRCS